MDAPISERIVKTPGTCGGKTRIAGHRITVLDIVHWHEHQGMSAGEIVFQYPSISLSDVYTALAYYFDHIEEIRIEMQNEIALAEEFRQRHPSLLEERLKQIRLTKPREAWRFDFTSTSMSPD